MSRERLKLGADGEQLAAEYLEANGYKILERNYRAQFGELDIIAVRGHCLVFAEVKTRTRAVGGLDPLLSIGPRKRSQVRRVAQQWLLARPAHPGVNEYRFDAIGVHLSTAGAPVRLEHVEGAF